MDVTDVTGRFGPWQRRALYVLLYRAVALAAGITCVFLFFPEVDHWCASDDTSNVTIEEWRSYYVPLKDGCKKFIFDKDGVNTNETITCDKWEFDNSTDNISSMKQEWSLVCQRRWLISFIFTVNTLGNFLMYIPSGYLADRFGRRVTCLCGLVALVIIGGIGGFSPNIEFFLVVRFLCGVCYGLVQTTSICLFIEAVGPEYRILMSLSFMGTFGIGMMLTAGLSYLIKDWRILHLIAYVPITFIFLIVVWIFVPEPPRWLLATARFEEAEKVILEAAKMNGIDIIDRKGIMNELKKKIEMDKKEASVAAKATILDLFRTGTIRKMTIILWLTLTLTTFVNYGFIFSLDNLAGSQPMKFIIMGFLDVLATGVVLLEAIYITRRRALLSNFMLSGVCFFVFLAVPENMIALQIGIAMIGKTCISIAFTLLYLFAAEIFPTKLRGIGVSGGMTTGRIGGVLSTFSGELGRVAGKNASMIMFGVLSMITGLLFLLLPETRDKHLPDTVKESERLPDSVETKATQ